MRKLESLRHLHAPSDDWQIHKYSKRGETEREFGIYLGSVISPQAIYFKEKVWLYV